MYSRLLCRTRAYTVRLVYQLSYYSRLVKRNTALSLCVTNGMVIAYYSLQIHVFSEKQIIMKQMQRTIFMLAEYYDHCFIRFTIAFISNLLTTIFYHTLNSD